VTVTLTTAGCPIRGHFQGAVRDAVMSLEGVRSVSVDFDVMDDAQKANVRQILGRSVLPEGALALVENMAREDLNPVEEARACAALVEELGLSREEVGLRVGRSRVAVSNLLRLLDLPDEALALLERGELSEGHGRALLLAGDHDARKALARRAAAEQWSVRSLEQAARSADGADGTPARTRREAGANPDQADACAAIADTLSSALGAEVSVAVGRGGSFRAQLTFATADDAFALSERLGSTRR